MSLLSCFRCFHISGKCWLENFCLLVSSVFKQRYCTHLYSSMKWNLQTFSQTLPLITEAFLALLHWTNIILDSFFCSSWTDFLLCWLHYFEKFFAEEGWAVKKECESAITYSCKKRETLWINRHVAWEWRWHVLLLCSSRKSRLMYEIVFWPVNFRKYTDQLEMTQRWATGWWSTTTMKYMIHEERFVALFYRNTNWAGRV